MSFSDPYLERVIDSSRSHSVFNTGWSSYNSNDFIESFLPFTNKYFSENFKFCDALELIAGTEKSNSLNGTLFKSETEVKVFTFHNDSHAANSKGKLMLNNNEFIVFVQLTNESETNVSFKFGENIKKQLVTILKNNNVQKSVLEIEQSNFNFSSQKLKELINNKPSKNSIINFGLKTIGVEFVNFSIKKFDDYFKNQIFNKMPKFDAGFIRSENPNAWAHGDIEERALKDIFYSNQIKKIYYGNWLRDYSSIITGLSVGFDYPDRQILAQHPYIDNDIVEKNIKSFSSKLSQKSWIKVIKLLATKEFIYNTQNKPSENILKHIKKFVSDFDNPTINMVGLYRPEEHIDNPKGMLDESILSNSKLNDPVQFTYEKSSGVYAVRKLYPNAISKSYDVNQSTMMKKYIKEDIDELRPSSFKYFSEQMKLAKKHGRTNKGFRHFGSAMHVLEDFYAHSNFVEISLIKLGHGSVNPWVDLSPETKAITDPKLRACKIPVVTGNFGQLDLIASLAPKIANEFFQVGYEEYKKLKPGDRTLMDEIIILILDDYIQKEVGMPANQKGSFAGFTYEELKSTYLEYLRLIDLIREAEEIPVLGSVITFYKKSMDLIAQTISLLPNFVINSILNSLDDAVKSRQTYVGKIGTNPSHTQLAKDSESHPLNDIAGYLAYLSVRRIGGDMKKCWKTGTPSIQTIINTARDRYFVHPCDVDWTHEHIESWVVKNKSKLDKLKGNTIFHDHGVGASDLLKDMLNKTGLFPEKM